MIFIDKKVYHYSNRLKNTPQVHRTDNQFITKLGSITDFEVGHIKRRDLFNDLSNPSPVTAASRRVVPNKRLLVYVVTLMIPGGVTETEPNITG